MSRRYRKQWRWACPEIDDLFQLRSRGLAVLLGHRGNRAEANQYAQHLRNCQRLVEYGDGQYRRHERAEIAQY